jgi:Calcineurin-like phosphoesterase
MRVAREFLVLPRAVEADVEIVAIGDIHGRSDLLEALIESVPAAEAVQRRLIFTGDLVDRGPDSLGALMLTISAGERIGAAETVALMGNHEILMRLALDPATPPKTAQAALRVWLSNGGVAVAEQLLGAFSRRDDKRSGLALLREATPEWVGEWLAALRSHYRSGDVLFVHAGVNPKLPQAAFLAAPWDEPLDRVDEKAHWAWVRAPFLDHKPDERGFAGHFVVHGHTPLDRGYTRGHAEQVKRFRLNLDGGSAMTGTAKMAILRGRLAEVVTLSASD